MVWRSGCIAKVTSRDVIIRLPTAKTRDLVGILIVPKLGPKAALSFSDVADEPTGVVEGPPFNAYGATAPRCQISRVSYLAKVRLGDPVSPTAARVSVKVVRKTTNSTGLNYICRR
jgi:hypothetical protein